MSAHVVPPALFDELAAGRGSMDGVLHAGQRSKRLLLLHELISTARARIPQDLTEADGEVAARLLTDVQRSARSAADEVLLQPHLGAWAARSLRDLLSNGSLAPRELGYLGAAAAAAALRAGQACDVAVHACDGGFMLPTYGFARAPINQGWCRVRARRDSAGVEIVAGDRAWAVPFGPARTGKWTPLHRLEAAAADVRIDVALDDLDPYRECEHLPVADRLDDNAVARWQGALNGAWALLVRDHRPVAEAIASAVVSVVPLARSQDAPDLSGTCFDAIGAVAMTEPRTPVNMALALSHELQHTKLSALLDLVALVDPAPGELFYAPWRKDPRPLAGLLQGTYAWLGLADFWDTRRRQTRTSDGLAGFELALARQQASQGIEALRGSERLTPAGQRFVDGMRRRMADIVGTPVSLRARRLADLACLDHAVSWRLRNLRPAPEAVAAGADAWVAGQACPWADVHPRAMSDGGGPLPSELRLELTRQRLIDPSGWRAEAADRGARSADVALVAGQRHRGADTCRRLLDGDPDDVSSWTGLALALAPEATAASWALRTHPELVAALHREIRRRSGSAPDVERLADWIGRDAPGPPRDR
jgi:HEXXH motif-containing protein